MWIGIQVAEAIQEWSLTRKLLKIGKRYWPEIIENFPEDYPIERRVLANAVNYVGDIKLENRKSFLSKQDYKIAKKKLKMADIVLVGDMKSASSLFIGGPLTHTLIYIGKKKFIHAEGPGVNIIKLSKVIKKYDSMMILRPYERKLSRLNRVIQYARKQLGKPYDFEFGAGTDKFYCSDLIYNSYEAAGINLKIKKPKRFKISIPTLWNSQVLHPMDFMRGRVRVVFKSHNLKILKGKVEMRG
jgi:uncharacterized protein YycO